ncbi:DEAD/DEAH family helicase [Spiroplasma syrphidicola EA-1]|uniref:DEAD/DEAH family helicase n=1 Tax=Spiroplasma syrphidicola EA-1 TaxID=1276229 RepID=R4U428_9MOLU|nr:DEAD/DEAH box helicase family protein [Spiroplasma syrphidicola]AGM26187.1 DEAD/DEAH family helicase [Spiroplasma syrphidicola EA-1]
MNHISKLFTNHIAQELITEFNAEMRSAQEVLLIFPFISKSIINKIERSIKYCQNHNIMIRIITTTFDDLAQFNDFNELERLVTTYNNILIHVEDNFEKRSERIHIKASIFSRPNHQSTVIIGSSNLTYRGMVTGREWNVKLEEPANKDVITKMINEFNHLWENNLINFNDQTARQALLAKIARNQEQQIVGMFGTNETEFETIKKYLYDYQQKIIDHLEYRRGRGKNKHLVIMATGTGKTVIGAFDYLKQCQRHKRRLKILFLAHQREIVEQALKTFRTVLQDNTFGLLMSEGKVPDKQDHLFATIQTMLNNLDQFDPNHFDYLIFDEAHHIAAVSFEKVFNYFQPREILGLTATPEREDGKSIKEYFDDEYAYELRVWSAINQGLLAAFDYYCIDDITTDLQGVDLSSDSQVFQKLNTPARNDLLFNTIEKYLGVYAHPTALIFCVTTEHAKIIANFLQSKNLRAAYLTSEVSDQRTTILHQFKTGRINYLCVVNMFNEGLDVPEIDTIILLRPTNSRTVYLQQLGRGLRKTARKGKLEVYDLISNIDSKYDLTIGIKNLFDPNLTSIKSLTQQAGLPYNCTITLEKKAQELILNNLKKWYHHKNRLQPQIEEYYQKYQDEGLSRLLVDVEMSIYQFYNHINDFYLRLANNYRKYSPGQNDLQRNQNLLKQFLFLDSYEIVNYFYLRLAQKLSPGEINLEYDNLLVTSLLYEVTSHSVFEKLLPNYQKEVDLVQRIIDNNQMIVRELLIILKYKLEHETLLKTAGGANNLLLKQCTFTVKQVLAIIGRTNFLLNRGALRIIAFQAGYLTFDNHYQVILADEDGQGYGKLTGYDDQQQKFYWSVPEKMTINHKIVKDMENKEIKKYLFLQNKINLSYPNLKLKLYRYIGIGSFEQLLDSKYLTGQFAVI